jgi:hypothetical protein
MNQEEVAKLSKEYSKCIEWGNWTIALKINQRVYEDWFKEYQKIIMFKATRKIKNKKYLSELNNLIKTKVKELENLVMGGLDLKEAQSESQNENFGGNK